MPILRVLFLFIALLFCFATPSLAIDLRRDQVSFSLINVEDGLSQSSGQAILQDYLGFMWFGTKDGLNRYDGDNFTVYRHSQANKHSIRDNNIAAIKEDTHGNLIIAFQYGGLNKYVRFEDSFQPMGEDVFGNCEIYAVHADRSSTIWVGTSKGLYIGGKDDQSFSLYDVKGENSSYIVTDICEGLTNVLWLASTEGLLKYDRLDDKCSVYQNPLASSLPEANDLTSVCVLSNGNVLVGSKEQGVFVFNTENGTFSPLKTNFNDPSITMGQKITSLHQDVEGFIWIGTDDRGLFLRHPNTTDTVQFRDYDQHKNALSNDRIRSIYEDRSGRIWIGTYVGGINIYDRENKRFPHVARQQGKASSLISNSIRGFVSQTPGTLWIATENGLDYWERNNNTFRHYQYDPQNPYTINSNRCIDLFADKDGRLWVSTIDGMAYYDKAGDRFIRLDLSNTGLGKDFRNNDVRVTFKDSKGNYWYGTNSGLICYDPKNNIYTGYKNNRNISTSLSGDTVYAIFEDSDGYIWISTYGGLSRFSYQTGQFTNFRYTSSTSDGLSGSLAYCFLEDTAAIWIGTLNGGLNRYDKNTGTFKKFATASGLPNETVYGILEDDNGLLWMSTNNGIVVFDRAKETTVMLFGMKDGLQSQEFNNKAYYKSADGEMFFGGINGFNYFFPENIKLNTLSAPIVFTGIDINRLPVRDFSKYTLLGVIDLDYTQNHVTFYFTTLDYTLQGKRSYSYKLEGYDKDWIYTRTNNISYEKLPSGKYKLLIKGTNADGVWNETPLVIDINIEVPPWRTYWAIFAYIALFCIGIRYIIRRQRQKVLYMEESNRRLNELVEEKTWELQLSMQVLDEKNKKLYFLTMHDELTGLFNRKRFSDVEDDFGKGLYNNKLPLCIIVGDVDGLKLVNDRLGHSFGDAFLQKTADILASSLREGDIACRIGGDEFALIVPNCDNSTLEKILSRLSSEQKAYNASPDSKFYISISLGYTFLDETSNFKTAFEEADEMMYTNKQKSKLEITPLIVRKIEELTRNMEL